MYLFLSIYLFYGALKLKTFMLYDQLAREFQWHNNCYQLSTAEQKKKKKNPLQLPRSTALHSWSTTAFVAPENSQKDLGLFDFILNTPTAVDTEVFSTLK